MPETICLDFDGVLHSYKTKWIDAHTIPDPPVDGAIAMCDSLLEKGFRVVVMSTRGNTEQGRHAMRDWLTKFGFSQKIKIAEQGEKPPSMVYVDDRAFRFTGDCKAVLDFIGVPGSTPKPWNKGV